MAIDRGASGSASCSLPINVTGISPAQLRPEPCTDHGRPVPESPTTRPWNLEVADQAAAAARDRRRAMDQADRGRRG